MLHKSVRNIFEALFEICHENIWSTPYDKVKNTKFLDSFSNVLICIY